MARPRGLPLKILAVVVAAAATLAAQAAPPARVYDAVRGQWADLDALLADLTKADVVFLGEQHDSPTGHRLELAVLEGLAGRRSNVILGLEMFERDVQEPLDHFSMGHITEDDFLAASRPWPRYKTDYKPLVDLAIAHDWPVIATNAPAALVTDVSKGGLEALQGQPAETRKLVAADLVCPVDDDYHTRFLSAIADHPIGEGQTPERLYQAQCVRDETMAESVAKAAAIGSVATAALVVHVNGAFHSDFHEGAAARVARRMPGKRLVVVSFLPVDSLEGLSPSAADRPRADYLVYSLK